MSNETREDIFLEKLSRLLQENHAKGSGMKKPNRTPGVSQQKSKTESRNQVDLRNQ